MTGSGKALQASYAECRRVSRCAASNFTPCFHLLSRQRRRAMEALYAFMRHTDDLADGDRSGPDASQALARWREDTAAALHHSASDLDGDRAILPAVCDTFQRFGIPKEYLFDAIDGAEMDLSRNRYESFEELSEYCYRVASVVGLACLRIWDYQGPEPATAAHACGTAFQLTNILRDLREDLERGRVYLPQEDLRRFGCSEESLSSGMPGPGFQEMMRFEVERTDRLYHQAAGLAAGLGAEGRRVFVTMIRLYYRLLKEIEADPARVLSSRVRLGRWRPLGIMAGTLLRPSAKAVLP